MKNIKEIDLKKVIISFSEAALRLGGGLNLQTVVCVEVLIGL